MHSLSKHNHLFCHYSLFICHNNNYTNWTYACDSCRGSQSSFTQWEGFYIYTCIMQAYMYIHVHVVQPSFLTQEREGPLQIIVVAKKYIYVPFQCNRALFSVSSSLFLNHVVKTCFRSVNISVSVAAFTVFTANWNIQHWCNYQYAYSLSPSLCPSPSQSL